MDDAKRSDAEDPSESGESGGGAYPNPHTGKEGSGENGFLGHGGQTEMAYHGTGQPGPDAKDENPNSAARED